MGGNVSEWTSSWEQHPQLPDSQVAVIRGSSFNTKGADTNRLTVRLSGDPGNRNEILGFRTASGK